MTQRILYEFGEFRLDPAERTLIRNQQPSQLRAKPFELLLTLVENHGNPVSKEDLVHRVWQSTTVSDGTFHVTLDALRKALGESGREPRFVRRTATGYVFVGAVKELPLLVPVETKASEGADVSANIKRTPKKHKVHVILSSCLYGVYFAVALLIEVAYQFDIYGRSALKIAPVVFLGMTFLAVAGLELDRWLSLSNKKGGLVISLFCFFGGAALLFGLVSLFLPSVPITESTLQAYPAQAAYLKDISYELVLACLFLIFPYHFVAVAERNRKTQSSQIGTNDEVTASRHNYPLWSFWLLMALLVFFVPVSLAMSARLLDHLKPGVYTNLFIQLVYVRALVFFGLGIECLWWYWNALTALTSNAERRHESRP